MNTKKVWFVTGASKGLGLTLVKELLAQGYQVTATSRTQKSLEETIGKHNDFLPLEMDITNNEDVVRAIKATILKFGRIDVVVNNAIYSQIGTLEELSDKEPRKNYDVNVFGSLNVIRNAAPHLREQKSGHIFNISYIDGLVGNFPVFGIYCATKIDILKEKAEKWKNYTLSTAL